MTETTAVFRSVDQHSGIVLTVAEIDRLKADNSRLVDVNDELRRRDDSASRVIARLQSELAHARTALAVAEAR